MSLDAEAERNSRLTAPLQAEIERIRTALAAVEREMWRPIETAPTGEEFLAYGSGRTEVIEGRFVPYWATHWMTLPVLPATPAPPTGAAV